jgi:hypothetical protein
MWPLCIIIWRMLRCSMALRCKPGYAAAVYMQSLPSTAAFLNLHYTMQHTVMPAASALHIANMPFVIILKLILKHVFNCTLRRSGECEWEPGSNRVLEVPSSAAEMQVAGHWGDTSDTEALEVRLLRGTPSTVAIRS